MSAHLKNRPRPTWLGSPAGCSAAWLGLIAAGCGQADLDEPHAPLPAGTPVAVSTTPELAAGEDPSDPSHTFHGVAGPFLLPDGGLLVVPLPGERVIRVFDDAGELVQTLGGQGEGPGEFVALAQAWADGASVEAFDPRTRRITRFGPEGDAEVIRIEGELPVQGAVPRLSDGSMALYGVSEVAPTGTDGLVLHHFEPSGAHRAELLRFEGMRRFTFPGGSGPDPLSPSAVLRAHGTELFVAHTTEPRIRAIEPSTGRQRVIEWDARRTRFPGDAATTARTAALALAASDDDRLRIESRFDALTGQESVPVFADFLVDEEGFLWIRPFDPAVHSADVGGLTGPGPGGVWVVLSPEGEEVGEVEIPADLEPAVILSHAVVGIRRDELGIESVRIHRVDRAGGG
jgi:hypothetical protein